MRTLLADDNGEIRAALRLLLEEMGERDILEAGDLTQALAAARNTPPDVVLLDWELSPAMPAGVRAGNLAGVPAGMGTANFVEELKRQIPGCRVIAMGGSPEEREGSLRAGCSGYVSRNDPPDRLLALLGLGPEGTV